MAMNQAALKASIKSAFLANIPSPTSDQITAIDTLADSIATAVVTCVSGAQITYISGLANGAGAVTGTFIGAIT